MLSIRDVTGRDRTGRLENIYIYQSIPAGEKGGGVGCYTLRYVVFIHPASQLPGSQAGFPEISHV